MRLNELLDQNFSVSVLLLPTFKGYITWVEERIFIITRVSPDALLTLLKSFLLLVNIFCGLFFHILGVFGVKMTRIVHPFLSGELLLSVIGVYFSSIKVNIEAARIENSPWR